MASSSSFQVSHHILCECDLPVRVLTSWTTTNPARRFIVCQNRNRPNAVKRCNLWDWYDEEVESEWYRLQLNEMYYALNPNQRAIVRDEITREQRIRQLEQDLNLGLRRLTFWKSTVYFLCMIVVCVWALK